MMLWLLVAGDVDVVCNRRTQGSHINITITNNINDGNHAIDVSNGNTCDNGAGGDFDE